MQMLIAEFVLAHIMHRTTSGSRRPAELPTDKTDRWKCMANNPVMRNAKRRRLRAAHTNHSSDYFGSYISSSVTDRQKFPRLVFERSPTATVEVSLRNFVSRDSTVVR